MAVPPYQLDTPTAATVVQSIVEVMGQHEGIAAWRKACVAKGQKWPGIQDDVDTLISVLQALATEGGMAEVAARSNIIRLHTWTVLSGMGKVRGRSGREAR